MDWTRHEQLSKAWRERSEAYVTAINRFVAVGLSEGWDAAGEQPRDNRGPLADAVLAVVEEANASGAWRELRARFPPAQEPFADRLSEIAVDIDNAFWIDEERVAARVGSPWLGDVAVVEFGLDGSYEATDARAVGRSPDRRFYALQRDGVIEVREGYRGTVRRRLGLPGDREPVQTLQPFPDGEEVLITREDGVFVLGHSGMRTLPIFDETDEDGASACSMVHAGMSPDGSLIAYGEQSSSHIVRTRGGELVARFGPIDSEYPHHAAFSPDGKHAIFNSCHLYNGVTSIVSTADLNGLMREPYEEDDRVRILDEVCRVYSSTFLDGAFVLGNAYGHLHAVAPDGTQKWQLFCGSSVTGVDVSPDGKKLAVATAAGFVELFDLDVTEPDPFQIGSARHRERIRFVKWKDRPILRW